MSLSQHTKNNASPNYTKIVDDLFSCANNHLMILIRQMLANADKKLFDLAEQSSSDEDRMKYMDCTCILQTEKNTISQSFFIHLNTSLKPTVSEPNQNNMTELSLVNQDEMEEMVAITTMHAKAMSIFGEEVSNLEARLEYLELMCDNSIEKESLDPKHICEVFQQTIKTIEIDINLKLVLYKLFDQDVCSKLVKMYESLNKVFIDNDIMPEIVLKTTTQDVIEQEEEEVEVSTQVASYYNPTVNKTKDFVPRSNQNVSHIVNEFMSGDMTISSDELQLPESFLRTPTQQDLEGKNCYDRKEVLKALSAIQRKITALHKEGAECITTEQIKQELITDISKQHGGIVDKQVNLLDERSIDFVGLMFGAIANDETVSEIMTNLIYQLQIPVMKVAMVDRSLFEEETHPARATVDLLTTAGKGINQKQDNLFHELEDIVDIILEKFDIDIVTFEKAENDLKNIIHKEEKLTEETERKQQKEILQSHARNIVITQLKMVSCERTIPNNVRPLVLKHWSTLMLNRYIRHGRDSTQWVQSVLLLKLLLKCMQPIKYQSQFDMIKNNHVALLEAVNDELYNTQQDKDDVSDQMKELKILFLKMIDSYDMKIVDASIMNTGNNDLAQEELEKELIAVSVDDTEEELNVIHEQTQIAKDKISQLASSTRPGVWYEIFNGEDRPVRRLKLSVILTDAAQLIFVDRKGLKVIEKDAEEFANELEDKRSRLIADHSTFDQALGNVISALAA